MLSSKRKLLGGSGINIAKYDPEIDMEFYANAWPTEQGVRDKRSWVRGQWIPFDEDAIN